MCGFISIFAEKGKNVIEDIIRGLLAIQHRGQDAAGIITFDEKFKTKKGLGLVRDVFGPKHLTRLTGNLAVGHVRYPTVGKGGETDVQPFGIDFPIGIAMAHNGNITNFIELKKDYFPKRNVHLTSDCDLEAVLYVFASALTKNGNIDVSPDRIFSAVEEVFRTVKGAYSVVGIIAGKGMFAFRDPYGIKPIILGSKVSRNEISYAVASESVVLDVIGYGNKEDLKPGEVIFVDQDKKLYRKKLSDKPHRPCIFELVYFARPDSFLDKISVYKTRIRLGEYLAERWKETGFEADVVIPVPESARIAALSMAQALGLPYREGFVKNRYIGRTFIMPRDEDRRSSVRAKLNTIRLEFKDKRVLIVDDSIVRGNTSKELVDLAKSAGASKVYFASYSPPLRYPCPYGIDMATKREFLARGRTEEEIAKEIGCDAVIYQRLEDLIHAGLKGNEELESFCTACFDGNYPTAEINDVLLDTIEKERNSLS